MFFHRYSSRTILEAFIFLFVIGALTPIVSWTHPLPGQALEGFESELMYQLLQHVLLFIINIPVYVYIQQWLINKYAKQAFSLREMFALDVVFTGGSSIVITAFSALSIFSTDILSNTLLAASMIFSLYMLIVSVKGIARIAKISLKESALVVLVPSIIFLGTVFTGASIIAVFLS